MKTSAPVRNVPGSHHASVTADHDGLVKQTGAAAEMHCTISPFARAHP